MNNFLAIDTSNEYLTVIAQKGGRAETVFEPDGAMQHSVRLMDAVEAALSRAGLAPRECDFFAAVTGPGSFTGIRIGISAVKGFCAALGKPALGVTTFQTLAYNAEAKALAVVPAGRGGFYACGFAPDGRVLLDACTVGEEELRALAREYAVYSYAELPVPRRRGDPAAGLLAAARAARGADFGEIGALYVKKSQAEREREERARLSGTRTGARP